MDLIAFVVVLAFTYFVGDVLIERKHYVSIKTREKIFMALPVVTSKKLIEDRIIDKAWLTKGSVVISLNYFKRFLAGLRNIVGGRVKSYESLLDRGRREAILRMKSESVEADIIVNMRFETTTLGRPTRRKKGLGCVEVLAYGTALIFKK